MIKLKTMHKKEVITFLQTLYTDALVNEDRNRNNTLRIWSKLDMDKKSFGAVKDYIRVERDTQGFAVITTRRLTKTTERYNETRYTRGIKASGAEELIKESIFLETFSLLKRYRYSEYLHHPILTHSEMPDIKLEKVDFDRDEVNKYLRDLLSLNDEDALMVFYPDGEKMYSPFETLRDKKGYTLLRIPDLMVANGLSKLFEVRVSVNENTIDITVVGHQIVKGFYASIPFYNRDGKVIEIMKIKELEDAR